MTSHRHGALHARYAPALGRYAAGIWNLCACWKIPTEPASRDAHAAKKHGLDDADPGKDKARFKVLSPSYGGHDERGPGDDGPESLTVVPFGFMTSATPWIAKTTLAVR